uniref:Uncharacterized protein n=1 Tax=Arundo donax TaxID=35708 RepID=A0A0A9PMH1_ARUDO
MVTSRYFLGNLFTNCKLHPKLSFSRMHWIHLYCTVIEILKPKMLEDFFFFETFAT